MTLIRIFAVNTLLTAGIIGNAFAMKKQFYLSVIYLTQSKPSVAVLSFEVVLCLVLYIDLMIKIFFSQLFPTERESLRDNIWPSLLNSCIIFAIFGKNSDYLFYFRLICLFAAKTLHFMSELRLKSMSAVLQMPRLFHLRFIGVLLYMGIIDVYQITTSLKSLRKSGLSFEILYLFEYSILFLSLCHICGEYILECIEQSNGENGWEERIVFSNYLELISHSLKALLEVILIRILFKLQVLPLFMIRNTVNNFKKAIECVKRIVISWRAISRFDALPNPLAEDLLEDNMCAICRDQIKSIESAKKLFCRHKFHIKCLKAWIRRQPLCPTCRSEVMANPPVDGNPVQNNERQAEEVENDNNEDQE